MFNRVISRAEINDRFFQVEWNKSTFDFGESEYPNSPIEVEEVEEIIRVTNYIPL